MSESIRGRMRVLVFAVAMIAVVLAAMWPHAANAGQGRSTIFRGEVSGIGIAPVVGGTVEVAHARNTTANDAHVASIQDRAPTFVCPQASLRGLQSSGGSKTFNARTAGFWRAYQDRSTGRVFGFVILAQGESGWRGPIVQESGRTSGSPMTKQTRGQLTLGPPGAPVVDYDLGPDSSIVRVAGLSISVDTANVLILRRADGVGGPPAVTTAGCTILDPPRSVDDPRSVLDRVLDIREVRELLGSSQGDATTHLRPTRQAHWSYGTAGDFR